MFLRLTSLINRPVTIDGQPVGRVHSFLFDDRTWRIRRLVVNRHRFLPGTLAVLSIAAVDTPPGADAAVALDMTRDDLDRQPTIDRLRPVSQDRVKSVPVGSRMLVVLPTNNPYMPNWLVRLLKKVGPTARPVREGSIPTDGHLRSAREVIGYRLETREGPRGVIRDLLVDRRYWNIHNLVVRLGRWRPWGRRVILSPADVETVHWADHAVTVRLSPDRLKTLPDHSL